MTTSARAEKRKSKGTPFRPFRLVHGLVKTIAITVGLPLTVLSLMSLIGLVTGNFWARSVPALLLTLVPPLLLVDRLLPPDDVKRARGLPTDVLALCWLGWSLLFVGFGQPLTGGWLVREGDRFTRAGSVTVARIAYWAGGVVPEWPPPPEPPPPATSAAEQDVAEDAAPTDVDAAHEGEPQPDREIPSDGGSADGTNYSTSELITQFTPAVVTIAAQGEKTVRSGTGFLIDRQGTVVTNQALVQDAPRVKVRVPGRNWQTNVEYLTGDEAADVALLRIPAPSGVEPLQLGDSDRLSPAHPLLCLGNPLGLEHTVADGHLVARQNLEGQEVLRTNVQISSGNAGGPLVNRQGQVVGLATTALGSEAGGENETTQAVIPINTVKAMIRQDYPEKRSLAPGPDAPGGR